MTSRSRRCPPADADPPTPPASSFVCLSRAFDNHQDLVNRADADAITITVKVPYPLELATAALDVDKADYCEWPLGNGSKEAETLAPLTKKRRPRHGRASGPLVAVGGLSTRPDQARVRR
jgi:predicted dehydrogenase